MGTTRLTILLPAVLFTAIAAPVLSQTCEFYRNAETRLELFDLPDTGKLYQTADGVTRGVALTAVPSTDSRVRSTTSSASSGTRAEVIASPGMAVRTTTSRAGGYPLCSPAGDGVGPSTTAAITRVALPS